MLRELYKRYFGGGSLKNRALKGGVVALGGFGAAQALRLVSNLVMTRLLAPDAFGLMAVTVAIEIWIGMMSDLGLDASIVRSKRGAEPTFLATARTLNLIRASFIGLILALSGLLLPTMVEAGLFRAGSVFADERLPLFMFAIAVSITITGFSAMRVALHNRRLNLVPVIRLELASQAVSIVAMIIGAVAGLDAFALALGAVVSSLAKTIGSHYFLKGPPARFGFDRDCFREIFSYGKWLVVASTLGFLAARGDQVVFGWLLALGDFALYSIGVIWVVALRSVIELVQRRVVNPTFAELHRERPQDLTRNYRRMRRVYEAAVIGMVAFVILFADLAVDLLYTDEYAGVAHYMKLVSLTLLALPYNLLSQVVLTAGDSKRYTIATLFPGPVLFLGAPVAFHQVGPDAAIIFAALTPLLAAPFYARYASKYVKLNPLRECAMAIVALLAAGLLLRFA
jgi:O-antigen/teichoic acid export membrane protein